MRINTRFLSPLLKIWMATLVSGLFMFNTAQAGWDEGVAAFTGNNFKLAAREFEAHTQQQPKDWKGHYMLGLSQFNIGMPPTVYLKNFQAAYDLNPNDLAIKVALKRALAGKGDIKTAAVQYMYGTTALQLGSKTIAEKAFKKAIKLDPDQKDYKAALLNIR